MLQTLAALAMLMTVQTTAATNGPCNDSCSGKGPDAARLDAAFRSTETTSAQREKMAEVISKHTVGITTDYTASANEYFEWRANEFPGSRKETLSEKPRDTLNYQAFRIAAENAVRSRLIDPNSAEFQWSGGFLEGTWKSLFQKRMEGRIVCGIVNAKNRFGGYVGATPFVVVLRYDGGVFVDMDKTGSIPLVGASCAKTSFPPPQPGMLTNPTETQPPAPPPISVADELAKLAGLKDKGILTQAEFEAQKALLLRRQ